MRRVQVQAVGVLHDVRLVDGRDLLAAVLAGIVEGAAHDPLGAADADRLDADARLVGLGLDLLVGRELVDELDQLAGLRLARLELDAGIQVFGVLADDDDIDAAAR